MSEETSQAEILAGRGGGALVEVPFDVKEVFGSGRPQVKALIDGMSQTHRKEYARWVGAAKKQETRDRRAARAILMLLEGKGV